MKLKIKKRIPHDFVLEALDGLDYEARPMFGCTALYVGEKIVLILRDREDYPADNGVWIATTVEHHSSLKREFPMLRSISFLGAQPTNWQNIPTDDPGFEDAVLRACERVLRNDPRIGKVPDRKRSKKSKSHR